MKKDLLHKPHFWLLLFFVVNLLQSVFTPIGKDEAYYWMYSQHLDWGYFDHPPLVALLIWLGSSILPGTLGVRLLTVFLASATVWLIWKLVPEEDQKKPGSVLFFFLLALSMPFFHIYGFITTPDVPLLFTAALWFHVFLAYSRNNTLLNALKLGLVAALLMYSKYHGAFLIIFSVLSKWKLLKDPKFWLAGLVGIILYLPHIWWQYQHDFISFRYHLVQRTDGFMGGKHIFNYIINIIAVYNPFLFLFFLFLLIFKKPGFSGKVPKVFPYVLWGFLFFFTFTALRDHIEPQWMALGTIPLVLMLHKAALKYTSYKKYIRIATTVSIVLILTTRLLLPLPLPLNTEFHKQKASYYEKIRDKAEGANVVFINSYSNAAKYTFYTGEPAFSYNCYDYRENQYDLWNYEEGFHKRPALFLTGYNYPWLEKSFTVEGQRLLYARIPAFPMINKVKGELLEIPETMHREEIQQVRFTIHNPYDYPLELKGKDMPMFFYIVFQVELTRYVHLMSVEMPDTVNPGKTIELQGFYYPTVAPGTYRTAVGLGAGKVSPVLVTEKVEVEVL